MFDTAPVAAIGRLSLLLVVALAPPVITAAEPEPAPMTSSHIATAVELMSSYAERTGLTSEPEPRRYLWTD